MYTTDEEDRLRRHAERIVNGLMTMGLRNKWIGEIVGCPSVMISRVSRGESQVAMWIVTEVIRRFGPK